MQDGQRNPAWKCNLLVRVCPDGKGTFATARPEEAKKRPTRGDREAIRLRRISNLTQKNEPWSEASPETDERVLTRRGG